RHHVARLIEMAAVGRLVDLMDAGIVGGRRDGAEAGPRREQQDQEGSGKGLGHGDSVWIPGLHLDSATSKNAAAKTKFNGRLKPALRAVPAAFCNDTRRT